MTDQLTVAEKQSLKWMELSDKIDLLALRITVGIETPATAWAEIVRFKKLIS